MTKPYGISPYRYKNPDGGWVQLGWRVLIRRRGYIVDRRFNADQFGGMDAAMRAAIAFRDEVNIECVPLSKREVCATVRTTNTSGVPGVIRTRDRGQDYWKARLLTGDGANRTQQFSIKRYGDQAAFDLAVQARSRMLETVQGFYVLHPDIKSETRAFPIAEYPLIRRPCKVEPKEHPYARVPECDVPGVGITNVKTVTADGKTYTTRYWTSMVRDKAGLPKRRYFSAAKYGEDEAKRLAVGHQLLVAPIKPSAGDGSCVNGG
ncbi:AP2 domain-containing protein [Massilia frigida]|nr:AP2 domain-containing protein [Massilia frigida]